jgi:hypothetical protein
MFVAPKNCALQDEFDKYGRESVFFMWLCRFGRHEVELGTAVLLSSIDTGMVNWINFLYLQCSVQALVLQCSEANAWVFSAAPFWSDSRLVGMQCSSFTRKAGHLCRSTNPENLSRAAYDHLRAFVAVSLDSLEFLFPGKYTLSKCTWA